MLQMRKWSTQILQSSQTRSRVRINYHPDSDELHEALYIAFDSYLSQTPISSFKTIVSPDQSRMVFDSSKGIWSFEAELLNTTRTTFSFSCLNTKNNSITDVLAQIPIYCSKVF